MQLNEVSNKNHEFDPNQQNMFEQPKYKYDQYEQEEQEINQEQVYDPKNRKYSQDDYVDSEEEEEQPQNLVPLHNKNSEDEEEVPRNLESMKSKFSGMQVENAEMFDNDTFTKNQQQMEPIEETCSSDDSFGVQQKYKHFQENLQFINEQSKRPSTALPPRQKRNHINLKTGKGINKENINLRNQEEYETQQPQTVKKVSKKLKRAITGKMRTTQVGFRNTNTFKTTNAFRSSYSRPKTANPKTKTKVKKIAKYKKKSDPVARYQQMQNCWSKNNLAKGGRKLDLAGFNRWKKIVQGIFLQLNNIFSSSKEGSC